MAEHDGCPGCTEILRWTAADDVARIPLRKAADAFREASDLLFELVHQHGWGDDRVVKQDAVLEAADDALASAALAYAMGYPYA